MNGFSERIVLIDIPAGPGVCLIENEAGDVLQVVESTNIRRRIGDLLDSNGETCVHGPKVFRVQRNGERIYIRWKLTEDPKAEKKQLIKLLHPKWKK